MSTRDHSACPELNFACGCIIRCIEPKRCSWHRANRGKNYTLVQFPCGCIASENDGFYLTKATTTILRQLEFICIDHYSIFTTDLAIITDLYKNRYNNTIQCRNFSTCYADEYSVCNVDKDDYAKIYQNWIWDKEINRARINC